MANPRKFSEKIALHTQKQLEETAAFEQIMKEVSDATSKGNAKCVVVDTTNHPLGCYRGGSLPNVSHLASNGNVVDLKNALCTLEELKSPHGVDSCCPSPAADRSIRGDKPAPMRQIAVGGGGDGGGGGGGGRERGRSPGIGPIRQRPLERRVDTSPYSSGPYLSPPPDTSWRRTNSDSALHQTATLNDSRVSDAQMCLGLITPNDLETSRKSFNANSSSDLRQRVPGINIYPSQQDPNAIQIPIGNNTGSLPDLTNFHFPSPLATPLDQDSGSPYSQSPQGASPSTLSPTSVTSRLSGNVGKYSCSPQDSPGSRRRMYHPTHHHTNQLSVPYVNSRYLHTCKGVAVEQHGQSPVMPQHHPPDAYVVTGLEQQNHYVYPTSPVTTQQPPTQQNAQQTPTSGPHSIQPPYTTYRTPHRPSPQTSPGLTVQGSPGLLYRSGSPGEASLSGPQSPVSPASSPGPFGDQTANSANFGYFNQAQALQQHFEQFSMLDNNPSSPNLNFIGSNSTHYSQGSSSDEALTHIGSQELSTDTGYFSQSPSQQLQFVSRTGGSTQQTTPQTPQTPNSIPEIVLSDYSTGHDLSKELGSTSPFDLISSDESLRAGLEPIDFDGLQMLADPEMHEIADQATEDNFRLDRLD